MSRWLSWYRPLTVAWPGLAACLWLAGCAAPAPVPLAGTGGAIRGALVPSEPEAQAEASAAAVVAGRSTVAPVDAAAAGAADSADSAGAAGVAPDAGDREAAGELPRVEWMAERQAERLLRERFAAAAEPADAALELVTFLVARERHREALAVAQVAWQRQPVVAVREALVGLYRDLGQRAAAVAELSAWRLQQGAQRMPPAALLELAELQDLLGEREEALATLAELRRFHEWQLIGTSLGTEVVALQAELAVGAEAPRSSLRDVLADLRGHPDRAVRGEVLAALVELADLEPAMAEVLAQAVAIACGDEDAGIRARAVGLARPAVAVAPAWLQAALADAAPEVRVAAAASAAGWLGQDAVAALGAALAVEQDPVVFRSLWQALRGLGQQLPELPVAGEVSAEGRAACVTQWRQACNR